jgi:hypothetical protein
MTEKELKIYETIFKNAVLFMNRGISEILTHDDRKDTSLDEETGIVSTLFIQMSIELALKAFLVKEQGVRSILLNEYQTRTEEYIFEKFENNTLHTKQYNVLKQILTDNERLTWFTETDFAHLEQFQQFRNKLVHLNLFLGEADLYDLKYELIYVIVHIIVPLLSEISFEFETPTEFYQTHLNMEDYKKLISFRPYVEAMEKLAKGFTGLNYYCPECYKKTYSPENNLCYCCNLNYEYVVEYTSCIVCNEKKSVIFDPQNIALNNHIMNGLCLNCDTKMQVHKCPVCERTYSFFNMEELSECTPEKCFYLSG